MRKWVFIFLVLSGFITSSMAQTIQAELQRYNNNTVPYITTNVLKEQYASYIILDARRKEEYEVSHLPGAIWVGENYKKQRYKHLDLNKPIVVYCSIGVRSEDYAEGLLQQGFKKVYNLHGGIFSWKNAENTILNKNEKKTDSVHTFSRHWKWYLKKGISVN